MFFVGSLDGFLIWNARKSYDFRPRRWHRPGLGITTWRQEVFVSTGRSKMIRVSNGENGETPPVDHRILMEFIKCVGFPQKNPTNPAGAKGRNSTIAFERWQQEPICRCLRSLPTDTRRDSPIKFREFNKPDIESWLNRANNTGFTGSCPWWNVIAVHVMSRHSPWQTDSGPVSCIIQLAALKLLATLPLILISKNNTSEKPQKLVLDVCIMYACLILPPLSGGVEYAAYGSTIAQSRGCRVTSTDGPGECEAKAGLKELLKLRRLAEKLASPRA